MKYILIIASLIGLSFSGSLNDLDEKNGFQEIKLNSNISEYSNFKKTVDYLKELGYNYKTMYDHEFSFSLTSHDYIYTGEEHSSIGDFKIIYLLIKVYNDRIHKITVICEPSEVLLETIKVKYGVPDFEMGIKDFEKGKAYFYHANWYAEKVNMTMVYKKYYNSLDSKNSVIPSHISLEYTSKGIEKEIAEEKEKERLKKIKDASDDF